MPAYIYTNTQVRQLRANIYGECSDHNWNECKVNWLRPDSVKWLLEHQPKTP